MKIFNYVTIILFLSATKSFSQQAPGNVSTDLTHWFKADAASATLDAGSLYVETWNDQSSFDGNADDATINNILVPADLPVLTPDFHNHNSTLTFADGETGYFDVDLDEIKGFFDNVSDPKVERSYDIIAVMQRSNNKNHNYFLGTDSTDDDRGLSLGYRDANNSYFMNQRGTTAPIQTVEVAFPNYTGEPNENATLVRLTLDITSAGVGTRTITVLSEGDVVSTSVIQSGRLEGFGSGITGLIGRGAEAVSQGFKGHLSELIIYNSAKDNATDIVKINSYLALKYGLTLDNAGGGVEGDYQDSSGAVIWDADDVTNISYHNDIIGIGRDNDSGLVQPISTEQTTDTNLTIDGSALTLSDKAFLMVGNNGGENKYILSGISTTYSKTIERIWLARETGTVGAVSVSVTLPEASTGNVNDYALLIANTSSFSAPTASINGIGGVTVSLSGNVITFTGINLTDGNFFTIGENTPISPGSVAGSLTHWFKADVSRVSQFPDGVNDWFDASNASNNAVKVVEGSGGEQITFVSGQNFNGALQFDDGAQTFLDVDFSSITNSDYHMISVVRRTDPKNHNYFLGTDTGNSGLRFGYRATADPSTTRYSFDNEGENARTSQGSVPEFGTGENEEATLFRGSYNNTSNSKPINVTRAGSEFTATENSGIALNPADDFAGLIGSGGGKGAFGFKGNISEIIIYNTVLETSGVNKIESYLSVKYGITLDNTAGGEAGDYVNSLGEVIWDASENSAFHHDVAGIGQDDGSELEQKQSKSQSPEDILTISIDATIAATNAANGGSFDDNLDFLMWGNDDATNTLSLIDFAGATNSCTKQLNRNWKISNIGTVGAVTLQFDLTDFPFTDFDLLVDTDGDGDYTTGTTRIDTGSIDVTGTVLTFTGVTLNHNDVITLAEEGNGLPDIVYNGASWVNGNGTGGEFDSTDGDRAVIIQGDVELTLGNQNCKCLIIESGNTLTVPTGTSLTIEGKGLELEGNLYLEGTAELSQTGIYNRNIEGAGQVFKILNEANASVFQYNYFASPIHNASGVFSIGADLKINNGATLGDNVTPGFISNDLEGFGTTFSTRWFHTLNDGSVFLEIDETVEMAQGVGFTMKGTSLANAYNLIGFPNNGPIELNVTAGNALLTGNPYASTIDVAKFFSYKDNTAVTGGTIYLWDQPSNNGDHSGGLVDTAGGYATIMQDLSVAAASLVDGTVTSSTPPTPFIKPGQGFIFTSATGGTISFDNNMREGVVVDDSRHFFKTEGLQTLESKKSIVRLGFEYQTNDNKTYHRQLATVLKEGDSGTEGNTNAYMFDYYNDDAYWIADSENSRYIITNISNVNEDSELPIGVVLEEKKEVTFKIDDVEDFTNEIYILDKEEGKVTEISTTKEYTTEVNAGDNQNRFSLVFNEDALLDSDLFLNNEIIDSATKTVIYIEDQTINAILEKGIIEEIEVYSLTGQKIASKLNSELTGYLSVSLLNSSEQLLVVRILTSNGTITKKIILN